MTLEERYALITRYINHGYAGMIEQERMVIAFLVTNGGCPSCHRK